MRKSKILFLVIGLIFTVGCGQKSETKPDLLAKAESYFAIVPRYYFANTLDEDDERFTAFIINFTRNGNTFIMQPIESQTSELENWEAVFGSTTQAITLDVQSSDLATENVYVKIRPFTTLDGVSIAPDERGGVYGFLSLQKTDMKIYLSATIGNQKLYITLTNKSK